jgi:CRP/FNR family transcriptional regulator, cyclic AMP receptor protein
VSVTNCNFCRAQATCALGLTQPCWIALIETARVVNCRTGAAIYRQGFPAEGVFLLCRGSVKLTAVSEAGTERILEFVTCGELFGLECLLPEAVRSMSAVARENCQGAFINKAQFQKALKSNLDLLWNVTIMLNNMLHRSNQEKLAISGSRVRERMEKVLEDLAQRLTHSEAEGKPSFAPLKQRELAELLGVPEETICRELRSLGDRKKLDLVLAPARRNSAFA